MATHPSEGVALLEGVEFPWDVRPMIRHHHERWDGTGYPEALQGEEIPLAARVLAVADVYDVLTSARSYRRAFSPAEAWEIMEAEADQTLDPELVSLFRTVVEPDLVESAADRPSSEAATLPRRHPDSTTRTRAGRDGKACTVVA